MIVVRLFRRNNRGRRAWKKGPAARRGLLLALMASLCGGVFAGPPMPGALYNGARYREGMALLRKGKVEKALDVFCRMYTVSGRKEIWTLSVNVLCSEDSVPAFVQKMSDKGLSPVVLVPRLLENRRCVRIGYGVAATRGEAAALLRKLPESMQKTGPFPVRIPIPCPGFEPPAKPSAVQHPQKPGPVSKTGPPPEGGAGSNRSGRKQQAPKALKGLEPHVADSASKIPSQTAKPVSAAGETWFRKGVQALGSGNTGQARQDFRESLKSDPGRPEVLNNLAITYISEGRYRKARDILQKVVAKAPGYSRAHLNLSGALWGLGERKDAIKEARLASRLDNNDINAHLTLATFLTAQGLYEEAKTHAQIVLILDPGNLKARRLLARIEKAMKAKSGEDSP